MTENTLIKKNDPILITGSGGFIGTKVTELLLLNGFNNLRCFVRPSTNLVRLESILKNSTYSQVDIIKGNLLVPDDCKRAVKDVALVYHCAAGTGKSFAGCVLNSAVATRNLLEALVGNTRFKRFVNVSSFSVYSNFKMRRGSLLDETCTVDNDFMERFDSYAFGKAKQDDIVVQYGSKHNIPYVILRPGVVFGPGREGSILGRSGIDTFGFFMHITGRYKIPLTYIDNCAEAIMRAGFVEGINGEVFNIVDDNLPSSSALMKAIKRNLGSFFSLRMPYHIFYIMCYLWEIYAKRSCFQLPPVFNRRKCAIYYRGNRYSNEKLKRLLKWKPVIPMNDALTYYFDYMKRGRNA